MEKGEGQSVAGREKERQSVAGEEEVSEQEAVDFARLDLLVMMAQHIYARRESAEVAVSAMRSPGTPSLVVSTVVQGFRGI